MGHVPLRAKIFGIVVAATSSTGVGVILWSYFGMGRAGQRDAGPLLLELLEVMAFSSAVGLVVAWLLTNVLTHQVHAITRAAQQVQRGNLSRRAPVWANDDIGELARSFNAMMDSLAHSGEALAETNAELGARNEELTALYELALLATHATYESPILREALQKMLDTSSAEAGAVLLRAEDGTFTLRASCQLPEATRQAFETTSAADPQFEQALTSERPLLEVMLNACDGSQPWIALTASGLAKAWMIPLRSHGSTVGLVLLFVRDARIQPPEGRHLAFILALCHEVSIAAENANLWDELTRKEAVRARLLANVVTAQEQERERISRELHDETGQSLTALLVQLRVFEHLQGREAILAHAGVLRTLVLETLEEVRRLARDLRPATLNELGLVPTIEWHVRTFTRNSALRVQLEADLPEGFRLPVHTEIALYRVVQEALTNVVRHSHADKATIRLDLDGGALHLQIKDNGCGFDVNEVMTSEARGLGLHGIQERVELIGGTLDLESATGQGTRLRVEVPVAEKVESPW